MTPPKFTIDCLRCTASADLAVTNATATADGGWKPIGAKRPEDWIAGPALTIDKGICPKCIPDWNSMQERFLANEPSDETIETRKSITFAAKKTGTLPQVFTQRPSEHIPLRDDEPARITSVPLQAAVPEAPQVVLPAAPPPLVHQQPTHMRGITMSPNATVMNAQNPVRMSRIPQAAQPVNASRIMTQGQGVKVVAQPGVTGYVAPTTMNRIAPQAPNNNVSAPQPLAASTLPPQNSYAVKSSAPNQHRSTVGVATPIVSHLPAQGNGTVTYSAPVPIEKPR